MNHPDRRVFIANLLGGYLALCSASVTLAASPPSEHTTIETMLRQLNALEAVAKQSAAMSSANAGGRYHLDYERLTADIARIRQGLQDYLTPSRAQPRDPLELSGSYRTEAPTRP